MLYKHLPFCVAILCLCAFACTKPTIVEDAPDTTATAAQQRQRAIDDYTNYYLPSATNFTWAGDAGTCIAGEVPQSIQDKLMKRINFYRRLVGLPTNCVLTTFLNEKTQKTALMMQSNLRTTGTPNPAWSCYSVDGANGWTNSLLADGYTASDAIDSWIVDDADASGALLDRRWILYSRAKTYGHGSTNTFAALYARHNFNNPAPTVAMPEYIAYPPKGYIVSDLFVPMMRWSFSIPNADFRTAGVTVKNSDGISIQTIKYPAQDLEADNTFVFQPRLTYALTKDTKFTVTISNVKVAGVLKTYSYEVVWVKR